MHVWHINTAPDIDVWSIRSGGCRTIISKLKCFLACDPSLPCYPQLSSPHWREWMSMRFTSSYPIWFIWFFKYWITNCTFPIITEKQRTLYIHRSCLISTTPLDLLFVCTKCFQEYKAGKKIYRPSPTEDICTLCFGTQFWLLEMQGNKEKMVNNMIKICLDKLI